MGWTTGLFYRISTMGWLWQPEDMLMLLLEVLSSHSLLLMQLSLLRRWSPTKGGVMIDSSHVKEVHIVSRKHICWMPRWTY
jgi:hypothetical protein